MIDTVAPTSVALPGAGPPRFRILGPVEVDGPAGVVRIPPGRQQVVLASLLVEANQVVSTEHLIDTLWEDQPPDTSRTQVQICMSRLRKTLSDAGVDVPIITRSPGYLMRVDVSLLDVHSFADKVAEARALIREGSHAEAAALLRSAVALWRGPSLSGIPHRTLRTRALRLDEDRLSATETYLDLELDLGRHRDLVGEMNRLVQENPLRERFRAQLMLALYRSGRQAEALEAYRALRAMLVNELGLEPSEELRSLEAAILSGDVPHQGNSSADGDGGGPLLAAEPAVVQRFERPRQLPADTADFIGDESLLRSAEAVLTGDGDRHRAVGVVVISGRPGIGKSTVATHIGHRVAESHFPDGQLYCDLRGTRGDPDVATEVLGRFLLALGIPGPMLPAGLDGRVEMYRTLLADRQVLVVLDDAITESQVLALLPGSGTCAVIITTRSRLTAVPGARQIELDVLDTEQSLYLLGQVVGVERVGREPEAAHTLVRRVGGLPLALRIVAARLAARPHWPLVSMVHRLANERHRLDELTYGDMTIRASLSLTYDGLDRQSRRLFALLSLSEGPTLPAWVAGAVLDDHGPYPSDLLEPLVDMQMLDVAAVTSGGEFRYRYHDIIRLFAREQLTQRVGPEDRAAAASRLAGGWLALAGQAHRRVYGGDFMVLHGTAPRWTLPSDHLDEVLGQPLDWMDSEQANLTAAISQAGAAGLDEACWDLAVTMVALFETRGYLDDWEKTHKIALAVTRAADNVRGTAALLGSLGTLQINRGQPVRSRTTLTQAEELFQELGDKHGLALCRRDLALLDRQAGDDDGALARYESALQGFTGVDDVVGRASVLTQSALILIRQGRAAMARQQLAEAMEIYRAVGYTGGVAHTLRRMGQVQSLSGDHDDAVLTMTEALGIVRLRRDVIGEGHLLHNLGQVWAAAGRYDQARASFVQALTVREGIMDHAGVAVVRRELAGTLVRLGEPDKAAALLEQAVAVFVERGMTQEQAAAERELATIRTGGAAG
ncbi:MAG TPA: BTAD domain-containing putative transcriptional regulator [Pseudonocardiaceae bacterium]